jgi:diguanylate cyclase (GGDEF)-like protein
VHGEDFLTTINAAAREEQLLREIAAAGTSLDPPETMKRIEAALARKIPCDALVFFVRHANALKAEYATGRNSEYLTQLQVPLGEGLTGWVGQNLQPVVNGNPAVDPGFHSGSADPLQSVLSLPLIGSQGLVAVLALYRNKKDAFSRADLQLVSAVVPNITSALENALAHREVESLANLDRLTGAYTRSQLIRFLDEELSRARRNEQPVTLLIVEVTEYWKLAESHGQSKADELLIAVGKRLRQASRDYDRLGRIAENRYALVLPGMKPAYMMAILDRMREIAVESGNAEIKLGGSFYPDNGDGARNLLSVGEQKLDGPNQRWEDSLRALLKASETTAEVPADALVRTVQ